LNAGDIRPAAPIRRQPEPPDGLDKFEKHLMAPFAPTVVLFDREFLRALLRYVRRLERDVGEGGFWSRVRPALTIGTFGECLPQLGQVLNALDAMTRCSNSSRPGGGCGWRRVRFGAPTGGGEERVQATSGRSVGSGRWGELILVIIV
jgi:hypothetical protein